jgi:hypothetical protein
MNNPDHISDSLETIFWVKILQFADVDLGWENIPDPPNTAVILRRKQNADFFWNQTRIRINGRNNMWRLFACGHNFLIPGCSHSSIWVEPEENWKVHEQRKIYQQTKRDEK